MAHDVFISYSSVDRTAADTVCSILEQNGLSCWIAPRDITPGLDFAEAIIDGIKSSKLFILVYSSNSSNSKQVIREVDRAVHTGIPVINLRLEDVPLSKQLEYYLSSVHWLDAKTPPLEDHINKLSGVVKILLRKDGAKEEDLEKAIRDGILQVGQDKKSIAVLPFKNISNDPDQEYFCDGLAEELINSLTKIKDIKVVARTSAFAFKGKYIDVREVGQRLNVEKILEGSVRKSGNKLRITAQLVNVADGFHLWSEKFDRDMEDIFAIQDEISFAIVDNLKVTLLKREEKALLKRYTEDPEAYNLYLKGIFNLRRYTAEGFQEAIKYFELTLQKDPDYALAYAGLSEVFYAISYWGNVPPHQAYPKVKEFAKKAIEIDKEIGEAHASLGMVYAFYDWNGKEAGRELATALELNPSSAIIHLSYSWFLTLTERHEEAVAETKRAQELDPLSPLIIAHVGLACIWGRQYDKAIQEMKAGMILAPDFYLMHYYLGLAYRGKQMRKENIAEFEKAVELSGGAPWPALMLACNYFETDQIEKGETLLQSLEQRVRQEYMPALGFAYIYFFRKDLDQTYDWLKRACEERDNFLPWCAIIPIQEYQLHNHHRLRPLYQKYGLIK